MSESKPRQLKDINNDYYKLCAELGHYLVNSLFKNDSIIARYKEFKLLEVEAKSISAKANDVKQDDTV